MDFQRIENELSEVEIALMMAVNVALNAALTAGADPQITVQHLAEHKNNFDARGQETASLVMDAFLILHKHSAGIS